MTNSYWFTGYKLSAILFDRRKTTKKTQNKTKKREEEKKDKKNLKSEPAKNFTCWLQENKSFTSPIAPQEQKC